jgi:energy-coupling factor transport system permease protein
MVKREILGASVWARELTSPPELDAPRGSQAISIIFLYNRPYYDRVFTRTGLLSRTGHGAGRNRNMNIMIQDVSIGGYVPGVSMLHQLDPRTKLVGLIVLLMGVFATRTDAGLLITCCMVLALIFLCSVGWRVWWWGLLRFAWMLLIAAGVNMIFNSGGQPIMIRQWELPITEEGVYTGLTLSLQLLMAITLSMVLTFTTTPRDLTRGSERLARPLKRLRVPVEEAGVVLLLAMRFVPLLQQELRATVEAQKSRGVEFGQGGVVARSKNLVAVLVPALMGTLRRSDLLAVAMTARGFQPGKPRSEYKPLHFEVPDYGAFIFLAVFSLCCLFIFR